MRELLTPGNINQQELIKHLHTYKPETKHHPRANKLQSKTYLSLNIQAAQSHTKPTDISKLITGHFIALQRKEIQLHPSEHQHKLPKPGNLDRPPIQLHSQ